MSNSETYGPKCCIYCQHYHAETWTCHAHPPVFALSEHGEPYGAWPPIEPGNFCGEFKPRPDAQKEGRK